jgi:hypothetical protein
MHFLRDSRNYHVMTYLSSLILFMTTVTLQPSIEETKTYQVKKIQASELNITGKGDSPLWKKATELSDFIYPWDEENPPLTGFKAVHNIEWLYCLFNVQDDNINIFVDKNVKSEVGASDRVEIFFKIDDNLSPYYGLEIDPLGRVMDYKAQYYRKFDSHWTWPAGQLVIKTAVRKDGYSVELAISKKSLRDLGLLSDATLMAGLYRGNCIELNGAEANLKWISWIKPDSKTPDFHIPSSFGILKLED